MRALLLRVRVLRTSAAKSVLAMASGSLIGQVILVTGTPFLSRLYPPESYGAFSVVLAIAAMVGPAAALRLESALILPEDEVTARRIFRLGVWSATFTSVASGLIVWLIDVMSGGATSWSSIHLAPIWVSAMVFSVASFSLLTQAALRTRNYATVAKRSITQSFGIVAAQLVLSVITRGPSGLLGGFLTGRMMGFIPLIITAKSLFRKPTGGSYRIVLRRYWRFPTVFTASALLNALGTQLPLLFVAATFSIGNAGELGMAQRLVAIPVTLLGASVAQVFAAELSSRLRKGLDDGRRIYLKTSAWMALIGGAIATLMVVLAPWLLPMILGDEWVNAGAFTQAMSISVGVGLVASPVSRVFMIYQRSRASLVVDFLRVVLVTAAIVVTIGLHATALGAIWLLYAALAINYIFSWVYGLRVVSSIHEVGKL